MPWLYPGVVYEQEQSIGSKQNKLPIQPFRSMTVKSKDHIKLHNSTASKAVHLLKHRSDLTALACHRLINSPSLFYICILLLREDKIVN